MTTTPLSTYLNRLFALHAGGWATNERSYYPALAELFNAIGGALAPKVTAIAEVADRGGGHPDFILEVETTHDPRAAVEVKGAGAPVADILRSEQVTRYLAFHDPVLVTNLREFVLARRGHDGRAEEIMHYPLAESEAAFWQTSQDELTRRHSAGLTDFLTNVLTWDAMIARPKDLAEALARYAREALRRLAIQPAASLDPLRRALSEALGLHFTDEQGEHFFRSSLVQTLFYGLFSAWAVWSRANPNADPTGFRWREAGDYLSLPVMRELFEHIAIPSQLESLDIRKPLEWAEATLRRTTWERFAAAFGAGDAVNYFYEPFLEAYDPTLREQLGVWYTPREIITYQVARVDRLLRDELGIPAGLA
ncbi:MAG: type ISP restriction/modification enzyme, partial [Ktedonobacterales bacterium]